MSTLMYFQRLLKLIKLINRTMLAFIEGSGYNQFCNLGYYKYLSFTTIQQKLKLEKIESYKYFKHA